MPETWRECEGQIIDGQFPLIQHLGGSDHSVVFLTQRGKGNAEKAAIKFLQADPASAEAQLSRWKQGAQLSHPNLIKLFESGRCHLAGMDLLYVLMEYASENLAEFLPQRALSPAETRDMLEPFVDTLSYLHGKGVVHGCIKPGNILAIDDQLKLSSDSIRGIGEGRIGGTKTDAYAAPESAQGQNSEAGDAWALGVTLVETLTQRVPDTSAGGPDQVQVADTLPEPFLEIARHCLQRKPKQRWTIAEISQKLNPKAQPPPQPPVSTQEIPAAAKPAAPPQPATKTASEAKPSAPAKAAVSIDPLSVPLSKIEPIPGAKKHALENQVIQGKKAPAQGYYVVVGVLLGLTVGAILVIPRFRGHQPEAESVISTAPSQPTAAKAQPKVEQKQTPPNKSTQRSALGDSAQEPAQTAAVTQPANPGSPPSPSPAPASLRSSVSRSGAETKAPFVADREASIKSGVVTPGEVLNQILPEISEKSRNTIHGTVRTVIKVRVDSTGSVSGAEIASGPSRFFASAALDAARRWDFAPAKIDGHAVASEWLLHFDFTPIDTKVTPLATKP